MSRSALVIASLLVVSLYFDPSLSAHAEEKPSAAELEELRERALELRGELRARLSEEFGKVICGNNYITFKLAVEQETSVNITVRKENILSVFQYETEKVPTEARNIMVVRDGTKDERTNEVPFSEYAYDAILECLD